MTDSWTTTNTFDHSQDDDRLCDRCEVGGYFPDDFDLGNIGEPEVTVNLKTDKWSRTDSWEFPLSSANMFEHSCKPYTLSTAVFD